METTLIIRTSIVEHPKVITTQHEVKVVDGSFKLANHGTHITLTHEDVTQIYYSSVKALHATTGELLFEEIPELQISEGVRTLLIDPDDSLYLSNKNGRLCLAIKSPHRITQHYAIFDEFDELSFEVSGFCLKTKQRFDSPLIPWYKIANSAFIETKFDVALSLRRQDHPDDELKITDVSEMAPDEEFLINLPQSVGFSDEVITKLTGLFFYFDE